MKFFYTFLAALFVKFLPGDAIAQTGIDYSKLVIRQNTTYQINSQTPFTGRIFRLYANGQKELEGGFVNGKKAENGTNGFKMGKKSSMEIIKMANTMEEILNG
jgi:antitoxin component YwqK of YwqJK toxin-antitoxin module